MSWWNAKYKNAHGEYEITFGSKYKDRAKAVEKVCQAVIDKQVKSPDDVAVVVRCKDCCHYRATRDWDGNVYAACHLRADICVLKREPNDFCSRGERKDDE